MYKARILSSFCLYACEEVPVLLPSHVIHKDREALGGNETAATVFHPELNTQRCMKDSPKGKRL